MSNDGNDRERQRRRGWQRRLERISKAVDNLAWEIEQGAGSVALRVSAATKRRSERAEIGALAIKWRADGSMEAVLDGAVLTLSGRPAGLLSLLATVASGESATAYVSGDGMGPWISRKAAVAGLSTIVGTTISSANLTTIVWRLREKLADQGYAPDVINVSPVFGLRLALRQEGEGS